MNIVNNEHRKHSEHCKQWTLCPKNNQTQWKCKKLEKSHEHRKQNPSKINTINHNHERPARRPIAGRTASRTLSGRRKSGPGRQRWAQCLIKMKMKIWMKPTTRRRKRRTGWSWWIYIYIYMIMKMGRQNKMRRRMAVYKYIKWVKYYWNYFHGQAQLEKLPNFRLECRLIRFK